MSLANPGEGTTSFACVFALTIALAHSATAQTSEPVLYISLDRVTCRGVQDVSVVINGRDNALSTASARKVNPKEADCTWIRSTGIGRHNVHISFFSLRIGKDGETKGRTPCRRATSRKDSNDIQLLFTRIYWGAHDLEIAGPRVDYSREVRTISAGDVPCSEKEVVPETLLDVQFDIEDLRLRLFEKKTVACGVILNDVGNLRKAKKRAVVPITPKQLESEVVNQGFKGKSCYAPTFTPVEALKSSLENKGLDITVK